MLASPRSLCCFHAALLPTGWKGSAPWLERAEFNIEGVWGLRDFLVERLMRYLVARELSSARVRKGGSRPGMEEMLTVQGQHPLPGGLHVAGPCEGLHLPVIHGLRDVRSECQGLYLKIRLG